MCNNYYPKTILGSIGVFLIQCGILLGIVICVVLISLIIGINLSDLQANPIGGVAYTIPPIIIAIYLINKNGLKINDIIEPINRDKIVRGIAFILIIIGFWHLYFISSYYLGALIKYNKLLPAFYYNKSSLTIYW